MATITTAAPAFNNRRPRGGCFNWRQPQMLIAFLFILPAHDQLRGLSLYPDRRVAPG